MTTSMHTSDHTAEATAASHALAAVLDDEAARESCPKMAAAIRAKAEQCRRYGWQTVTTLALLRVTQ